MEIACAEAQDDDCAARVRNVLAQDPINYAAVFQEGVLSLAKGEVTKAERNFEYLSKNYPQDAQARFQLALAYLASATNAKPDDAREKIENADSHLNEAVALDPQFEPAVLLFAERKIRKPAPTTGCSPRKCPSRTPATLRSKSPLPRKPRRPGRTASAILGASRKSGSPGGLGLSPIWAETSAG